MPPRLLIAWLFACHHKLAKATARASLRPLPRSVTEPPRAPESSGGLWRAPDSSGEPPEGLRGTSGGHPESLWRASG
eukprot:5078618-Alexandrium_andersonii.AAC.1